MAKKTTTRGSVYFKDCKTFGELENKYLALITENIDNADVLEAINKDYDEYFIIMRDKHNEEVDDYRKTNEGSTEMRTVATALIGFKDKEKDLDFMRDCRLELCGTWLWISPAEGKPRETLGKYSPILNHKTGIGCTMCKTGVKKGLWYWRSETGKKWMPHHVRNKRDYSMNDIRGLHGSEVITDEAV